MGKAESNDVIRAWLRTVAMARAEAVVEVPGGAAVLHSRYPQAHDHNRLLLWNIAEPAEVSAAADKALGDAGLSHRLIDVQHRAVGDHLEPVLRERGYERSDEVVMTYDSATPPAVGDIEIVELDLAERAAIATAEWRAEQPDWTPDVAEALGQRVRTMTGAVEATFLAVRRGDRVVARADLYVRDGIAQVEEVMTDPSARKQGLATALVRDAVRRGRRAGVPVIFLIADAAADGGAGPLYRRLGFVDAFEMASFAR